MDGNLKRITANLTIASAIACGLFVILFSFSYNLILTGIDTETGALIPKNSVYVTERCRCGVSEGAACCFSHEYPFRGSLRLLGDDCGGVYYQGGGRARMRIDLSCLASGWGFSRVSYIGEQGQCVGKDFGGDLPGIYYRHFDWLNGPRPVWTLRSSLWYPILLFAILPSLWQTLRIRARLLARQRTK